MPTITPKKKINENYENNNDDYNRTNLIHSINTTGFPNRDDDNDNDDDE